MREGAQEASLGGGAADCQHRTATSCEPGLASSAPADPVNTPAALASASSPTRLHAHPAGLGAEEVGPQAAGLSCSLWGQMAVALTVVTHLTCQGLRFLICKVGLLTGPSLQVVVRMKWANKCLAQQAPAVSQYSKQVWVHHPLPLPPEEGQGPLRSGEHFC